MAPGQEPEAPFPPHPHSCTIRLTFPTNQAATTARRSMKVDEELQPAKVSRTYTVEGPCLVAHFWASDTKMLRVAVSSFYDMVMVVVRTLQEFDLPPGME